MSQVLNTLFENIKYFANKFRYISCLKNCRHIKNLIPMKEYFYFGKIKEIPPPPKVHIS